MRPVSAYRSQLQSNVVHSISNPNRRPAASRTRMPSGTTSLPMPSPGIVAMRCFIEALRALSFVRNGTLAYQESATRHTRGPVLRYPRGFGVRVSYHPVGLRSPAARHIFLTGTALDAHVGAPRCPGEGLGRTVV